MIRGVVVALETDRVRVLFEDGSRGLFPDDYFPEDCYVGTPVELDDLGGEVSRYMLP